MFLGVPNSFVEDINNIKHNFNYSGWLFSAVMIIMITICIWGGGVVSNAITFKPNIIKIRSAFLELKHADGLKDERADRHHFLYVHSFYAYRANNAKNELFFFKVKQLRTSSFALFFLALSVSRRTYFLHFLPKLASSWLQTREDM
jgi:hypothetical protein